MTVTRGLLVLAVLTSLSLISMRGDRTASHETAPTGQGEFLDAKQFVVGPNARYGEVAGDFNGDGNMDLAVTSPEVNSVSLLLGKGNGTFLFPTNVAAGPEPIYLATGDFNGDKRLDLVSVQNKGSQISVVLGNGDGSFQVPSPLTATSGCLSVLVADFNGDQKDDIAAGCTGGIVIFLGNGDGTFQTPLAVPGTFYESWVALDVNHDGKLDIVLSGTVFLQLFIGNGDGTFQNPLCMGRIGGLAGLATGDFNNDHKPDLIWGADNNGYVGVLLQNLDNTFSGCGFTKCDDSAQLPPRACQVGTGTGALTALAVGDWNHDGHLDAAFVSGAGNIVSIMLGNGTGKLGNPRNYAVGIAPNNIVSADFNRDGILDLAVLSSHGDSPSDTGSVSILLGDGKGGFQSGRSISISEPHHAPGTWLPVATAADMNGDGIPDFVTADNLTNAVVVKFGTGKGVLKAYGVTATVGIDPSGVVAADFNGDGFVDVATSNYCGDSQNCDSNSGSVSVLLGRGDGSFQSVKSFAVAGNPASIASADFNRDGVRDLVVSNNNSSGPGAVSVLLGNGDGTFDPPIGTRLNTNAPRQLVVANIDNDSSPDLAVVTPNNVEVLLGNGDGTFLVKGDTPVSAALGITAVDFNHDGKVDLAVTNGGDVGTVTVLLGNGDGTFKGGTALQTDRSPAIPVAGDFNGDGLVDLAISASGAVDILLGKSEGTFRQVVSYPVGGPSMALVGEDLNADDAIDLVAGVDNSNVDWYSSFEFLLNTGGTKITLTSSPNPSNFGQLVTFTANVVRSVVVFKKSKPTGTVTFLDGTNFLGTVPLAGGTAVFSTSTLSVGTHSITAAYSGDANYNAHTSGVLSQVVNP